MDLSTEGSIQEIYKRIVDNEKAVKLQEKLRGLGLSTEGSQKELFDRLLKATSANKKKANMLKESENERQRSVKP